MKIDQLIIPQVIKPIENTGSPVAEGGDSGFADLLKKAMAEVNGLQNQSAEMKQKLVVGEIENVHDVMIAAEKADLAFQLTMQVRNKIVEAYQEIMRMQV